MDAGSAYGLALHGVMLRGGAVPESVFNITCGSPVAHRRKRVSAAALRERLIEESLLEQEGGLLRFPGVSQERWHVAKREVERVLLEVLGEWLKRNGFASYEKVRIRGSAAPVFAGFAWGLTAPSYMSAFRDLDENGNPKPGFVVADVHVERHLNLDDVRYFVWKCEAIRSVRANRPFIPFLVAPGFSKDAWMLGRKHGYQFVTLRTLLGQDLEDSIEALFDFVSTMSLDSLDADAQLKLLKSFKSIGFDEGRIRGLLFELLVLTLLAHDTKTGFIGHEIKVPAQGNEEEVSVEPDVVCDAPRRLQIIECKGYRSNNLVSEDTVRDWLERRIPRLMRWAAELNKVHNRNRPVVFELWTTSYFEPDATKLLESSGLSMAWKDRDDLEEEMDASGLCLSYLQHFAPLGSTSEGSAYRFEVPQDLGARLKGEFGLTTEIPGIIDDLKSAARSGDLSTEATTDECLAYVRLIRARANLLHLFSQRSAQS